MKKIIIAISFLVLFLANPVYSQLQLGAQVGPQIPIDLEVAKKIDFGFNVSGKYFLEENMAIGINIGKHWFGTNNVSIYYSIMPVTGLFEYYFSSSDFKPYIGMDLGLYMVRTNAYVGPVGFASSNNNFGVTPKVGLSYYIARHIALTADVKFHIMISDPMKEYMGVNFGIALDL